MTDAWVFGDAPNTAVFTVKPVLEGEAVVYVTHDEDDGAWQFIPDGETPVSEARLVSLEFMVRLDPTLSELADLPLGWVAQRESVGQPWNRRLPVADECGQRRDPIR